MIFENEYEANLDRCDDGAVGPKSIKEILDEPISAYTGSEITRKIVENQIRERWGEEEAKLYDPFSNALPFRTWLRLGYRVIRGEKAIRSITFREVKEANGQIKKYPKTVCLFYQKQVQKM